MKVLHIGNSDSGGAGKGMINLHRALKSAGVDSKVLVANKFSFDEDIVCAEQNLNLYSYSKNRLFRFIQKKIRKKGWSLNQIDKYYNLIRQIPASQSSYYTFPITHYDISQHPLVKEADIIHLHWIADFVDFPTFFPSIDKPIVWTLRDENPGLGGFHFESARKEYGKYYESIENGFLDIKRKSLLGCKNLTLVAMSDIMKSFCAKNEILRSFPVRRIDNLVDISSYRIIDQSWAKKALGLDDDGFVVLFVAVDLGDPRKNLKVVHDALRLVPFPTVMVCVGKNDYFSTLPDNVVCLNSVNSERLMSVVYSAADVFVTPALQESFGKTTIEALSCGTPVISSKAGIAPEVITPDNGVLLDDITDEDVAQALRQTHNTHFDRESIRYKVLDHFNPYQIVEQYIQLYEELVS